MRVEGAGVPYSRDNTLGTDAVLICRGRHATHWMPLWTGLARGVVGEEGAGGERRKGTGGEIWVLRDGENSGKGCW